MINYKMATKQESTDDELRQNVFKMFKIVKPYLFILLLLIPLWLSFGLRTTSLTAPLLQDHASNYVHNAIYNDIESQVQAQYPLLPLDMLKEQTQEAYNDVIATNKPNVDGQIELVYQSLLSNIQDDQGQTYLSAIDPYFWLRFTENGIETGHVYDELKEGRGWDTHMLAPEGRPVPPDMFHTYFQMAVYKMWSMFDKTVYPLKTAYYSPLILIGLSIIILFFLLNRLVGPFGAMIGSSILALHPFLLTRTYGGFADTDAYVVLFPLLAVWLFTESFITKNVFKRFGLALLAGLSLGLFKFAWSGWWFIFDIMLAAAGCYSIYLLIKHKSIKKAFAKPLQNSLMLILGTMILVGLDTIYLALIKYPFSFINLKSIATMNIWPNVFTTVAEQNPSTWSVVINNISMGYIWILLLCVIGLVVLFKKNQPLAIICLLWLGSTMWASTKGTRFILMVIPAFSLCMGYLAGWCYKNLPPMINKHLKIYKHIIPIVVVISFSLLLMIPFSISQENSKQLMPDISDAWVTALTNIKQNSNENAIILSWWDFGHWFKYWADRQVTFDGTSQSYPQAHWVGRVLLTNDELEAHNIIRMVHCSSDKAYKKALELYDGPLNSINNLKRIIMEDKTKVPAELVGLTHCDFPQTFVIVSQDMVNKAGVWAHFGLWDFDKAYQYNVIKNNEVDQAISILKKQYPEQNDYDLNQLYYELNTFSNDQANSWISSWPNIANQIDPCTVDNDTIKCNSGIELINNTLNLTGDTIPPSVSFVSNNTFYNQVFDNPNVDFSMVLFESNDLYYTTYMQPVLADSLFVRLYYFKGVGLNYFNLVDHQQGFGGDNIFVYEVVE